MRRLLLSSAAAIVTSALWVAAMAQPGPAAKPDAAPATTAAPKATAAPEASPAPEGEGLPPGHPPTSEMPPGHPPAAAGGDRGGFSPPQDSVSVVEGLPPGVVDIQIVDGDEQPVANAPITLTILKNSVTEGESTSTVTGTTDAQGRYNFSNLQTGSGISYTVTTSRDQASFASGPFGLKDQAGVRVLLHSYEPITSLAEAPLVMEAIVLLDVKQDTIAVNHLLRTLNVGRTAYVATDVRMPMPEGAKAFNQGGEGMGSAMGGVAMVESDGQMELTGTFPPGEAELTYRYNLPLDSGGEARLKIPLPPRVVATRVVVGAGPKMNLEVAGFPKAASGRWQDGKRVLQTTKQANTRMGIAGLMQNTSPQILDVHLTGLPSSGPAPMIALLLALAAGAGGLVYLMQHRDQRVLATDQRQDLEEARDALLGEFAVLEKARRKGDIGPRTYDRLRAALLDALARIVNRLELAGREPRKERARSSAGERAKMPAKRRRDDDSDEAKASDNPEGRPKRRKKRPKRATAAKARG